MTELAGLKPQHFIWEMRGRVAVIRLDRPDRSLQLGAACAAWPPADHYVLIGDGTYIFARSASRAGIDPRKLVLAEHRPIDEIFETIISLVSTSAMVMGMGNIGGPGLQVVQYFRNRSRIEEGA